MTINEFLSDLDKTNTNKVNLAFEPLGIKNSVGSFMGSCRHANYDVLMATLAVINFSEKLGITGEGLRNIWNEYMTSLEHLLSTLSCDNLLKPGLNLDMAKASLRELVGDDVINNKLLSDAHPLNLLKVRIWAW